MPIHPDLAKLLCHHLTEFGTGPPAVASSACRAAARRRGHQHRLPSYLSQARAAAFTEAEAESLVAQRPYDLRHAAVSTWLNATGDPAQVAEAGRSHRDVLLQVHAKCISGRQEAAKGRT